MVMVIETSSIDRGADISQFSQYSNEQEFLYLPCSFIQKRRGSGRVKVINGGLVTFVPIKVNLNIKMQTVTQLKKQKKELHLVSARAMMDGVKFQVAKWVKEKQEKDELKLFLKIFPDDVHLSQMQKFADDILDKCSKVVQKHKGKQVKDYANDQTFQELISEVLCIKSDATEAVKWQENRMRLTNGDTAPQIQSKYKRLKMGAVAFGHQNFVYSVAFHPTLPIFATGSKDRTVKVWRFKSDNSPATCVKTLDSKDFKSDNSAAADAAGPHVTCVAFHPNPNLPFFATCCQNEDVNRSAILWQINLDEFHLKPVLFATLQGHNDSVECAAFHRVAPVLATGSWDRTIMLWRFNPKIPCNPKEPLLPLATLQGHGEGVLCLAFHPNYSQFLASCSKDRTAKLWRLEANNSNASCVATCDEDGISESECVEVSDGQGEYEGFDDQHEDEDYDEGSGEERDGDDDSFDRGGNNPSVDEGENDDDDDERDDSEEEEETIECDEYDEDVENEEEEEEEEGEEDEGGIQCLAFHPKLPILATTHGKTARLWFLGKFLQSDSSLPTCATPHTIACEQKDEEEDNAACVSLAFHPTLSILATGSYDGAARLWHLEFDGATSVKSEKCINQLDGHSDSVQCVAFHPSAPVLVTGSWDNTAKVWCLDQK
jgi:WD40 repeat protein